MSSVEGDTPELAGYYDRASSIQFEMGLALLGMMKIRAGDAVLDVGCGTGDLALRALSLVGPSGSVTGVDPSAHRIRIASDKVSGIQARNVHLRVGQGEDLGGLPDGSFDHAYYCAVFHWISDKKAALRETYRVLKPGGSIGITARSSNGAPSIKGIANRVLAKHHCEKMSGGSRWDSKEELEALLSDAGFVDITMRSITIRSYFQSPGEFFLFLRASSFGQPSRVPEHLRPEVRQAIVAELEKRRTPSGIEIKSNPLLVIATKPR